MAMNKIGDDNLYVGGLMSFSNGLAIKRANITHVVTVLRMHVKEDRFKAFDKHLHIPVDDIDDEDLMQYFPAAIEFIQSGLDGGGGVLVHCAMGKSRSATICLAYLLHRQPASLKPLEALELVRQSRPMCEPNDGFMAQLELYVQMGCPDDVVGHPLYQRWLYQKSVEESVACGKGPELEEILFEDQKIGDQDRNTDDNHTEIRCRKCRRQLASSRFIISHAPGSTKYRRSKYQDTPSLSVAKTSCAHIFLHPLTWMRPSLFPSPSHDDAFPTNPSNTDPNPEPEEYTESPLSGRITCPNETCGANIGKFTWPGMPCSCGAWIVPAIAVARARVDVIDSSVKKGTTGSGGGIRLPPGMVRTGAGGGGGSGGEKGSL